MKLVILSDTHGHHRHVEVPDGDVLIHCGDATMRGKLGEVRRFGQWLAALPHRHKIFVAGNHDWAFQKKRSLAISLLPRNCHYLEDSAAEIEGVKFWGSPWQPWFLDWAFNVPRGEALKRHWDLIPSDTDVLVTHTPPLGIGDRTADDLAVGCEEMMKAVERVKPRVHCFGHIHEGYGSYLVGGWRTEFVNASICNSQYRPINEPIVMALD